MGVSPELNYKLTSTAVVQDAPELIRNIDFATDMLMKNSKIKKAVEGAQAAMGKVTEFFANFEL